MTALCSEKRRAWFALGFLFVVWAAPQTGGFAVIPALKPSCAAQTATDELVPGGNNVLLGLAAYPGIGMQASYVAPGRMYTREAVFLGDVSRFTSTGSSQIAVVIGASLRIIGSLEVLGMTRPRSYDVHVGTRIGPGLRFGFDEDRPDRNQRFNLIFEPFVRLTIAPRRLVYFEAGLARPKIRVGLKL